MLKKIVRFVLPLAVALAYVFPASGAEEPPKQEKNSKAKKDKGKHKDKAGKHKAEQPKAQ
jgi:hypothetical protein